MGGYPVLHLDLNARKYETAGDLVAMLNQYLEKWELQYGVEKQERSPEERFAYVIEQAYAQTGKQVVVLIDEYDKPLLQALSDENGTEELTMQGFYDETKGVFKVSTKDIATDLYIYVIDESRMSKKKTDTDFREELEHRAIVRKVIHLQ